MELKTAYEFDESSNFNVATAAGASSQGICTNGTNIYTSDTYTIRKYSMAGSLVTTKTTTSDGTAGTQNGGLIVIGSSVYSVVNNYPTTPKKSFIREYDLSLNYIAETAISTSEWMTGGGYDGSCFWTVTDSNIIQQWGAGWTSPVTYTPNFTPTGTKGWQDVKFDDQGNLLTAVHEGSLPDAVSVFEISGTDLKLLNHIIRPFTASQGFDYYGGQMYFIARATQARVIICDPRPDDGRANITFQTLDSTQTNNGGSGTYANLSGTEVFVYGGKKNDIVRVDNGMTCWVSAGISHAQLKANSNSSNTEVYPAGATYSGIHCNETGSDGETLQTFQFFRLLADGDYSFCIQSKAQTAGIGRYFNKSTVAKIVSRASN